jgi:hypothetical protein
MHPDVMRVSRALVPSVVASALVVTLAPPALAHDSGAHAPRTALVGAAAEEPDSAVAMTHVANLPHEVFLPDSAQNGSDIEFLTLDGRDYALAGTLRNGLQIVDVSDPTTPQRVAVYECPINQGDIQVFRQGDRVLATYTADSALAPTDLQGARTEANQARFESQCVQDVIELGTELDGRELGTFLVDLTDPANPTTVSFIEVPEGSHNQTVHPSGDYLYNSNSDLLGVGGQPEITIHDISDPENPRFVQNFRFPPVPTSLGTESHDIFFNGTGTRAYAAALSSTLILDTTDPEAPVIIEQIIDPSIEVVHQSDLVSLPRADGTVRDLLVITDEQAGAAANASCPGGGLHVYDVTGELEQSPAKLGVWFIDSTEPTGGGVCTSHVLRLHPDQALLTIAWYTAGVRVLDISGLAEVTGSRTTVAIGEGVGMKEIGHFDFPDSDTWSFKTNRIESDGSFFGYGNDLARGLDVYRFDGELDVPVLAPEDLGAPGCTGVPVATAYGDRDEASDAHRRSIDCVIARSIAVGQVRDGARVYVPQTDVTRGQMATFIVNTLRAAGIDSELPEPEADAFTDTDTSVHRDAIAVLAAAGIVTGTGDGTTYEPNGLVTRAQMASFMVRAAQFAVEPDLAETGERRFTDVSDAGTHADAIAIGDDNGLFMGTSATTFAPRVVVQRGQMASFLTNLLTVAGEGNATPPSGTSTA